MQAQGLTRHVAHHLSFKYHVHFFSEIEFWRNAGRLPYVFDLVVTHASSGVNPIRVNLKLLI